MSGIRLTEVDDATIATPPAGKATVFLDDVLGPAYKDDAGAVHDFTGADAVLTYLDHGNTGSTETVTASAADIQRLVANAATVTLTLAGWPASGTPAIVRLWLEQDGTGGRVWSFPGAVDWGSIGEPSWATRGGGDVDVVDLMTIDGGTNVVAVLQGRQGATGADGKVGGAIAIPYTFSTTTTDSDPGSGNVRLDNATQLSATKIRVDLVSSDGTTWTSVIDTLDDSTNTVKGHIRLFKTSDPTKWIVFTVSAVDASSGYRNITAAVVAGSGANPFSNGDALTLAFTRNGDVGASGTAQVATDPIWDTKGDIAVASGADAASKLPAGADGQGLIYRAAATLGLEAAEILPWRHRIIPFLDTPDATTGTWTRLQFGEANVLYPFLYTGTDAGQAGIYNSSVAQNDAISWDVVLAQGTWDCHIWVRKSTNTGIITLNMDAVSQGTADTYAASAAPAKLSITGIAVATTGKKRFQLKAATKNASSSGYLLELFYIEFRRTA